MTATEPHGTSNGPPAEVIRRQLDLHVVTRGRVVFLGLGGIGLFLIRTVAAFLAGLCRHLTDDEEVNLLLVDGKDFSERHLYRLDVPDFTNKAAALADELLERYERPGWNVRYVAEFATPENIAQIIREGDLVLMGVDNHATRNLVSRHCAAGALENVIVISAGNDGVDLDQQMRGTYGNVQVYIRTEGENRTAPLHQFHPEIAAPADQSPAELGCDETGEPQLTVTNSFAAAMAAAALLRLLALDVVEPPYDEACFDVYDATAQPHWFTQPHPAGPSEPTNTAAKPK